MASVRSRSAPHGGGTDHSEELAPPRRQFGGDPQGDSPTADAVSAAALTTGHLGEGGRAITVITRVADALREQIYAARSDLKNEIDTPTRKVEIGLARRKGLGHHEARSVEELKEDNIHLHQKVDDIFMDMNIIRYFINSQKDYKEMLDTYNEVSKTDTIKELKDQIEEVSIDFDNFKESGRKTRYGVEVGAKNIKSSIETVQKRSLIHN